MLAVRSGSLVVLAHAFVHLLCAAPVFRPNRSGPCFHVQCHPHIRLHHIATHFSHVPKQAGQELGVFNGQCGDLCWSLQVGMTVRGSFDVARIADHFKGKGKGFMARWPAGSIDNEWTASLWHASKNEQQLFVNNNKQVRVICGVYLCLLDDSCCLALALWPALMLALRSLLWLLLGFLAAAARAGCFPAIAPLKALLRIPAQKQLKLDAGSKVRAVGSCAVNHVCRHSTSRDFLSGRFRDDLCIGPATRKPVKITVAKAFSGDCASD